MQRRVLACLGLLAFVSTAIAETRPTNIVYMMADELGYYEPSYMGNPNIQTPNLDRMAAEGIRFNNLFAGSSVCAPTRCCFLTGKHSGHTSVRVNGGGTPMRAEEETIASMLKPQGYATGGFGKWGCGGRDSTGVPEKHGFDVFLGYYDQVHAHSYYPPYILRNSEEVPLAGQPRPERRRDLLALRHLRRRRRLHPAAQGRAFLLLPARHAAARRFRHPGLRSRLGALPGQALARGRAAATPPWSR